MQSMPPVTQSSVDALDLTETLITPLPIAAAAIFFFAAAVAKARVELLINEYMTTRQQVYC